MGRTRLATVWLGGCSGCHMSFLDLDEFLLELAGLVEVVFSPVVDAKEYPPRRGRVPDRRARFATKSTWRWFTKSASARKW
jgi:hypothetical protein